MSNKEIRETITKLEGILTEDSTVNEANVKRLPGESFMDYTKRMHKMRYPDPSEPADEVEVEDEEKKDPGYEFVFNWFIQHPDATQEDFIEDYIATRIPGGNEWPVSLNTGQVITYSHRAFNSPHLAWLKKYPQQTDQNLGFRSTGEHGGYVDKDEMERLQKERGAHPDGRAHGTRPSTGDIAWTKKEEERKAANLAATKKEHEKWKGVFSRDGDQTFKSKDEHGGYVSKDEMEQLQKKRSNNSKSGSFAQQLKIPADSK